MSNQSKGNRPSSDGSGFSRGTRLRGPWHRLKQRIGQYRIASFFALAYALSWTLDAIPGLLGWVFNGSNGSVLLAMLMYGTDNATTGQEPLDLDVVLVGDAIDLSTLVTLNGSRAVITRVAVLLVVVTTGVHPFDCRGTPDRNTET